MSKLIFPTTHTHIRYTYEDADNYHIPTEWLANFTWTGRDDYLEWVADWKVRLKQKIVAIRNEKADRRDTRLADGVRNAANIERQQLRIDCFNLFIIRKIGKHMSAKQRDDRRNSIAA
jgi:hypothetical protein